MRRSHLRWSHLAMEPPCGGAAYGGATLWWSHLTVEPSCDGAVLRRSRHSAEPPYGGVRASQLSEARGGRTSTGSCRALSRARGAFLGGSGGRLIPAKIRRAELGRIPTARGGAYPLVAPFALRLTRGTCRLKEKFSSGPHLSVCCRAETQTILRGSCGGAAARIPLGGQRARNLNTCSTAS